MAFSWIAAIEARLSEAAYLENYWLLCKVRYIHTAKFSAKEN